MQIAEHVEIRFAVLLCGLIGLPLTAVRDVDWSSLMEVASVTQQATHQEQAVEPSPAQAKVVSKPIEPPPPLVRGPIRLTNAVVTSARSTPAVAMNEAREDDSLFAHHPLSEHSRQRISIAAEHLQQLGALHWRLEAIGSQYRCVCQLQPAAQPTEIVEVNSHPASAVENVVHKARDHLRTSLSSAR